MVARAPAPTVNRLSSSSPPAMPPDVFSVTTFIQSLERGNRAFRQPAWRRPSSPVRPSRTRTPTRSSPLARCSTGASDREAASYILLVQFLPTPGQHDVATVHHG